MDAPSTFSAAHALRCDLAVEIVRNQGAAWIGVQGTSMVPALHPGDLLRVERATPNEICLGDILVFARQGRLISHRVTMKRGAGANVFFTTQGDRLARPDAPVPVSAMIGRVTEVQRRGTRIPARSSLRKQQALAGLLRRSDRATSLYLRLVAR